MIVALHHAAQAIRGICLHNVLANYLDEKEWRPYHSLDGRMRHSVELCVLELVI